jgi:hypothetical protein
LHSSGTLGNSGLLFSNCIINGAALLSHAFLRGLGVGRISEAPYVILIEEAADYACG